jgi:hypothetical protein
LIQGKLATRTSLNLNQPIGWLREVDLLRQGQLACTLPSPQQDQDRFRAAVKKQQGPVLQTRQNRVYDAANPTLEIAKLY